MRNSSSFSKRAAESSILSDISLMLENTKIIESINYIPTTKFTITFIKYALNDTTHSFIITIKRYIGMAAYSGMDASSYCIIKSIDKIHIGETYLVFGKVCKGKFLVVYASKCIKVDYRSVCYQIF